MRLGKHGQKFFVINYETTGLGYELSEPIEVGIIVCDHEFALIETYQSLINLQNWRPAADFQSWLPAFKVHGISPSDYAAAPEPRYVGAAINNLAVRHSKNGSRPILVSDNIQFEWHWTRKLLELEKFDWPFHYCGWDTSLFLEAAGVGDPKPAHRALADAGLLHAAIVKALDRTRNLR